AGPFADAAPAFDAIVPRDLRPQRQRTQIGQRPLRRMLDQAADAGAPALVIRNFCNRIRLDVEICKTGRPAVRSPARACRGGGTPPLPCCATGRRWSSGPTRREL